MLQLWLSFTISKPRVWHVKRMLIVQKPIFVSSSSWSKMHISKNGTFLDKGAHGKHLVKVQLHGNTLPAIHSSFAQRNSNLKQTGYLFRFLTGYSLKKNYETIHGLRTVLHQVKCVMFPILALTDLTNMTLMVKLLYLANIVYRHIRSQKNAKKGLHTSLRLKKVILRHAIANLMATETTFTAQIMIQHHDISGTLNVLQNGILMQFVTKIQIAQLIIYVLSKCQACPLIWLIQVLDALVKLYARGQLLGKPMQLAIIFNIFALKNKRQKLKVLKNHTKFGHSKAQRNTINGSKYVLLIVIVVIRSHVGLTFMKLITVWIPGVKVEFALTIG